MDRISDSGSDDYGSTPYGDTICFFWEFKLGDNGTDRGRLERGPKK